MNPNNPTLPADSGVKPQPKRSGKKIDLSSLVRKEVAKLTAKLPSTKTDAFGRSTVGYTDPEIIHKQIDLYNRTKNLQQKEDALVEFLHNDPIAKKRINLDKLSMMYLDDDHDVKNSVDQLEAVLNPFANIRGTTLQNYGLTMQDKLQSKRYANAALNDYISAKFGLDMPSTLQFIRDAEVTIDSLTNSKITHRKIKELLALDDWSAALRYAAPLLTKYVPQLAKWGWEKYIKPKVQQYIGTDEGFITEDSINPLEPFKRSYLSGFNKEIAGVRNVGLTEQKHSTTASGVSTHSLKTHICPEYYVHRQTTKYPEKTALGSFMLEINLITNNTGTVMLCLAPGCIANTICYFSTVYNNNTFNADTLNQVGAPTVSLGPLYTTLNTVSKKSRLCGFSVQVVPIVSYNTAGYIQMSYFSTSPTGASGSPTTEVSGFTPSDLAQAPYYSAGNNKTVYRMITLPSNQNSDGWSNPGAIENLGTDLFVILLTGFAPSISSAKIQVFMTFEFLPRASYAPICPSSYPQQGPLTNEFLSSILARFPLLQSLTNQDAKKFAEELPDNAVPYDVLMDIIIAFTKQQSLPAIQPIEMNNYPAPPQSMASFDIE